MCTGRIDLAFVLRAFRKGADGVLIAGCHLKECNYLTQGNFYALSMVNLCKKLMEKVGLSPDRLRMEMVSGGEANRFVEIVNGFSQTIHRLGPVYAGGGEEIEGLRSNLEGIAKLVPYIKIANKDKLAVRLQDKDAYERLYTCEEIDTLLQEVSLYYISPERCQACMMCAKRCPVEAIDGCKNRIHVIDQERCIKCGKCFETCPPRFGAVTKISGQPVPQAIPEGERTIDRRRSGK